MKSKIEAYISKSERWKELEKLRTILQEFPLHEEVKWGAPCYSYKDVNVVILGELKDCTVLGFFKGVLFSDPEGRLSKPGDHTQSARTLRFKDLSEISRSESLIRAYVMEAIEVEKSGLQVSFPEKNELQLPDELLEKFRELPGFETAFKALTPGRQRAYVLHFASAKQSKTRVSRIEKYQHRILDGKGMLD